MNIWNKNKQAMTVAELVDRLMEFPSNAPVLIDADLFQRIRKCICGQWFFAAKSDRLTCSDKCRFAKHEMKMEQQCHTL